MRYQWSLILGLIFALITALFAVINVNPVQVNFGFTQVSLPLILIILGCALIGGLAVGSYGIYSQYKLQKRIKQLTIDLTEARAQIERLESANAPLTSSQEDYSVLDRPQMPENNI